MNGKAVSMKDQGTSRPAMAGGFFIAIGLLLGIAFGIYVGQISLGMMAGFLIGCGVALLIWVIDRARKDES